MLPTSLMISKMQLYHYYINFLRFAPQCKLYIGLCTAVEDKNKIVQFECNSSAILQ